MSEGDELLIDTAPYEHKVQFKGKEYAFKLKAVGWPEMEKIRSVCLIVNQAAKTTLFDEEKYDREVLRQAIIEYPQSEIKDKDTFIARLHPHIKNQLIAEILKYEKEAAELAKKSGSASAKEESPGSLDTTSS